MFVEGGLIGVLLGSLNNTKKLYIKYPWDIVAGGLIITACELTSGIVLNRWLGFNIWDYSHAKYNFLGQIDLLHSTCWFILSPIVFWLDDVIRFYMFNEKRPASLGAYFVRSVDRT